MVAEVRPTREGAGGSEVVSSSCPPLALVRSPVRSDPSRSTDADDPASDLLQDGERPIVY